jgi:hypothetical protein
MWAGVVLFVFAYAYLAFVASLVVLFLRHRNARAVAMLSRWTHRNGFFLIGCEIRRLDLGPFLYRSSPPQVILRFAVLDKHGHRQTGWARCGHPLVGLFGDRVTVRWDAVPAGELHVEQRLRWNRKSRVCDQELDASMDVMSFSDGRKADQRGKIGP